MGILVAGGEGVMPAPDILALLAWDVDGFLKTVEASGLAARLRDSLLLFPLLESTHVLGLALVFGTVLAIDLRLLGVASAHRPFRRMSSEILKWTWAAFALTALTGTLMFTTNARVYYHNFYFRAKMLLLLLAGINMLVFELTAGRQVHRWDKAPAAPPAGKVAAILSIAFWVGIVCMGRIIGFTTSREKVAAPPPPSQIDFDDFLGGGPGNSGAPPPPGQKK
ncbi:MAG TPA: DUF6644 family protein [Bryobacteraceae bacterium]|nr:DUF6644 family protein [Bryobacteraceae bacterium]